MRAPGDFNWATLRNADVCLDSDTIAHRRALRVQIRKAKGTRTFRGHDCGLSHGQGNCDAKEDCVCRILNRRLFVDPAQSLKVRCPPHLVVLLG
jgi:hypothetical protein